MPYRIRLVELTVCHSKWNWEGEMFSRLQNSIDSVLCTRAQHRIQQAVISVFLDNAKSSCGVSKYY